MIEMFLACEEFQTAGFVIMSTTGITVTDRGRDFLEHFQKTDMSPESFDILFKIYSVKS